jgi:hypothetical protein
MILACVNHIASQLNQFLKNSFELSEDIVVVSNLVGHDGSMESQTNNRLAIFLTNIEKDTMPSRPHSQSRAMSDRDVVSSKPIFLNLYLMVAANFTGSNYPEGLKFISNVIAYFQQQQVFNHQNSPDLDPGIDKIILDIENFKSHELSNLWGMFGAKYVPSVVYKVRMVVIDSKAVQAQVGRAQQNTVSTQKA